MLGSSPGVTDWCTEALQHSILKAECNDYYGHLLRWVLRGLYGSGIWPWISNMGSPLWSLWMMSFLSLVTKQHRRAHRCPFLRSPLWYAACHTPACLLSWHLIGEFPQQHTPDPLFRNPTVPCITLCATERRYRWGFGLACATQRISLVASRGILWNLEAFKRER